MSTFSRHWSQLKPPERGSWLLLPTPFPIGVGPDFAALVVLAHLGLR